MKHKAIFIEGLPGSGKTTFARKLHKALDEKGIKVKSYSEGELNPIDLAWCALFDEDTYAHYKKKYPMLKPSMEEVSIRRADRILIPFLKLERQHLNQAIIKDFEQHEIYNARAFSTFRDAHLKLWKAFEEEAEDDTVYIFECVFLQNHINELILKYNLSSFEKRKYFKALMDSIKALNPVVYYVFQEDVDSTLMRIIEERRSPGHEKFADWIDLMVEHLSTQPFGKKLGYEGVEGVFDYFKDRQNMETHLLETLQVQSHRFMLKDDYDTVFDSILAVTNDWLTD